MALITKTTQEVQISTETASDLLTRFILTPQSSYLCSKYYLMHWTGQYLKHVLAGGTIVHQDIEYVAVPIGFSQWRDCFQASQLQLSFRQCDSYLGFNVVLIKEFFQ
jgi:hypothetical protein